MSPIRFGPLVALPAFGTTIPSIKLPLDVSKSRINRRPPSSPMGSLFSQLVTANPIDALVIAFVGCYGFFEGVYGANSFAR